MKLKNIKQSSVTLMAVITISKLFGMLREIVLANYFGTSNVSDAYLIASSVPTLLFYFIGQSLSTAYIPMYSKIREKKGEKEAQTFSNNLLNIVLIIATVIVLLLLLFPNIVVKIFAAGFDSPTSEIASRLIRISAPSIYIMVAVYICTGYLQANKSFLAPAAVSLPRNLIVVVSIAFAASFGTDYLGWGLLASYLLEFMFLIPFVISKGYRYKPIAEFKDPHIKETFYMIVPILIGIGVNQLNKIIDKSIASTIVEGGISALSYASIIDVAISDILVTGIITILFVDCAQLVAKGDTEKVKSKISSTINAMTFLLIPATFGIFALARPIVVLILCRGSFDENSLNLTTNALMYYILGLVFLAVKNVLIKVYYAYGDTKTTTVVSISGVVANIVLNFVLSRFMGIYGLALSTSISAMLQAVLLYFILRKKIGGFGLKENVVVVLKSLIAAGIMSVAVIFAFKILEAISQILALAIAIIIGCVIYFVLSLILKNKPIVDVLKKLKKS